MACVQLPQAVKILLRALISQRVVALKDTSLGIRRCGTRSNSSGQADLHRPDFHQNQVPTVLVLAMIYIGLNLILTWIATWVQKKFVGETKVLEVSAVTDLDTRRAV